MFPRSNDFYLTSLRVEEWGRGSASCVRNVSLKDSEYVYLAAGTLKVGGIIIQQIARTTSLVVHIHSL